MMFLGMLFSAGLGFVIGMMCKTIIDSKAISDMQEQLDTAETNDVQVIEIKDERLVKHEDEKSVKQINYFDPF